MNQLEYIKKDSYLGQFIKDNMISDDFIIKHPNLFMSVLESRNKCVNCKGLYNCCQLSKGERLALSNNGVIISEIELCDYLIQENKKSELANSFVYSDIPSNLVDVDLNTLDLLDDGQKMLCAKMMAILTGKENKGLYISGDLGVGKTYLCIGLANALAKKKKKVAFMKATTFINEVRKLVISDQGLYDSYINKMKECTYLFIDDIGSESVSSFSRDDVLFNILDYRMENKLTTIFTSNLNKEDLLNHYTFDKKDNSNLMRARRLMERIDILSEDYVLSGKNKRR